MPIRLLNVALLIAAVIGGVLAYRASREREQLLAEWSRLEEKVGSLPIGDPSKVHVRALETGEELHFAWRVYFPAGFRVRWECSNGGSSSSWNSDTREFIARVRLREDEHGNLYLFAKQDGSSMKLGLGDDRLADLLRDRWHEVRVEQLGSDGVVVVDANQVTTLLRLTLCDDLEREAEEKLGKHFMECFQAALFHVRFGSDQAFQQAAADSGETR